MNCKEKDRLNRRILLIDRTELARELNRYRRQINKLGAIKARKVAATSTTGIKGRVYYSAFDEYELLHQFLDDNDVDSCYI